MDRASAAGEFVELRVQDGDALGPQGGVQTGGVGGGDHPVIAQGKKVAGHGHDLGVTGLDGLDLAVVQEGLEGVSQDIYAGDSKAGGGHAEEDVEMQEMLGEGDFFNLP